MNSSAGFPLVSRPDFGAYALSSSRSECGGLGSHGLSVLAAHSQFGTLSGWFVEETHGIFWGLSGLCGRVDKWSVHNCAVYLLLSFLRVKYETELE